MSGVNVTPAEPGASVLKPVVRCWDQWVKSRWVGQPLAPIWLDGLRPAQPAACIFGVGGGRGGGQGPWVEPAAGRWRGSGQQRPSLPRATRVKGSLELPPRGLQRAPAGVSVGMLGRGQVPILPSGAHCHGDES